MLAGRASADMIVTSVPRSRPSERPILRADD